MYLHCITHTDNFPPNISGNSTFRVTLNQETVIFLTVEDPGDNFTLSVQGGLPRNSILEDISDEDFIFRWTPLEVTYDPIIFVANDSRGAATTFTPTVQFCACVNRGNCTLDTTTTNATIVMNCQCTEGTLFKLVIYVYIPGKYTAG